MQPDTHEIPHLQRVSASAAIGGGDVDPAPVVARACSPLRTDHVGALDALGLQKRRNVASLSGRNCPLFLRALRSLLMDLLMIALVVLAVLGWSVIPLH